MHLEMFKPTIWTLQFLEENTSTMDRTHHQLSPMCSQIYQLLGVKFSRHLLQPCMALQMISIYPSVAMCMTNSRVLNPHQIAVELAHLKWHTSCRPTSSSRCAEKDGSRNLLSDLDNNAWYCIADTSNSFLLCCVNE